MFRKNSHGRSAAVQTRPPRALQPEPQHVADALRSFCSLLSTVLIVIIHIYRQDCSRRCYTTAFLTSDESKRPA